MAKKSSRRDFLRGRLRGGEPTVPEQAASEAAVPSPDRNPAGEDYLLRVARRAMAAEFEVVFNMGQYPQDTEAALAALDVVEGLEEQMSFFRATSEITRINVLAVDEPLEVEPRLFELIQLAMDLHRQTDGAFDIAAAALWEAWGFARRAGKIPTAKDLADARERTGSRWIELDAARRTVHITRPGVKLNLGAIGKGYALDRAAEALAEHRIDDFLFHGGQSSLIARGSRLESTAAHSARPGWTVGIRNPLRLEERIGEIRLHNGCLGTSGSSMQFFRHRGHRYSHILDPRTGHPAEKVLSATVVAPSATLADGLSTAFFVLGQDFALDYCRAHPGTAAVLVCPRNELTLR
jgi:thiamine biosynthesis lipoprotein